MHKFFTVLLLSLACTGAMGQVKDSLWDNEKKDLKIDMGDSKWDLGISFGATYNYSFNAPSGLSNSGWGLDLSLLEMRWKGWDSGSITMGILDLMFDWQYMQKGNKFSNVGVITPALDGKGYRNDFTIGFPVGINQQFGKDFGISLQAVPGIGLYGYQNEFVENGMRHKDYLYPDKGRVGFRLNLKATIWYSDFGVLVRYNPLASKDFGTTILSVGIAFRD